MKGIRRTGSGWQVYTKKGGRFRSKHFPPGTSEADLKREYAKLDALATLNLEPAPATAEGDTLKADVERYLQAVAGMKTYVDRAYRIRQWRDALGPEMKRQDITPLMIRRILEQWRQDKLSPGSLNLRRTALMHFFTVTDPEAHNPVKRVPRYRETPPPLHLPTLAQAKKAIGKLPDGKPRARLLVLLWTGWPPAQLMRVTEADVDLKHQTVRLRAREKGAGAPAVSLPLLPQAVVAMKHFHQLDAYGPFDTRNLIKRLHKACKKAKVKPFRIYDLRHLFLTTIATITKDDRLVAELAQHRDIRQTRRYTEQSVNPRLLEGLKRVTATIGKR